MATHSSGEGRFRYRRRLEPNQSKRQKLVTKRFKFGDEFVTENTVRQSGNGEFELSLRFHAAEVVGSNLAAPPFQLLCESSGSTRANGVLVCEHHV